MACFLWALGNLFILLIFQGRLSDVKATMDNLSAFFLAGASLFLPYGFNQLKSAFKS
jgi:hypothetical protein